MTPWLRNPVAQICQSSRQAAEQKQQRLTKPLGSLGRLETLAIDFAGFQKTERPQLSRVTINVFAGDHGIVEEAVSAFPQQVTAAMIRNFSSGGAAVTVLARLCDAEFSIINLGTATPLENLPKVRNVQIANGTENFCNGPAMTKLQCAAALQAGRESVSKSCQLFIGGEMGIGNTTSAAAIYCALLGDSGAFTVDSMVGRGTGVDDAGLARKKQVVQRGLQLHVRNDSCPEQILRCLGGFEIAALVGAYIGSAQKGIPSLVDGYIATAAALVACRINPAVKSWLLFSHCSAELAHRRILNAMQVEPLLDLGMRLGEGCGAALAVPLLQSALKIHTEMATFAEAGISPQ